MTHFEELTPAEVDPKNQHLIQELQKIYAPDEADVRSLASMRQQLLQNRSRTITTPQQAAVTPVVLKSRQERPHTMNTTHADYPERGQWQRHVSTFAAVVFATVLVGSLLLLLTHARQSSTGGQSGITPPASHASHWYVLELFSGNGSTGIYKADNLNIVLPNIWEAKFVCMGPYNDTITAQIVSIASMQADCSQHIVVTVGSDHNTSHTVIHKIRIISPKFDGWQLLLEGCSLNTRSACGSSISLRPTPVVMPTPAPSQLPTPIPTPTPPETPTPIPTPTPFPPGRPTPTPPPTQIPTPTPKP